MGIMNGTTNFILDAMITDSRDFDDVLKEAQALGYAEANPSADIDGLDTARKTAISSSIAFDTIITEEEVNVFGLRNIKKLDIDYITKKLGKTVRYMGFGTKNEDTVSVFVEPTILDAGALEANVNKNFNMISLFGKSVGRLSFYGQGAGKYPTGNSLAQDVIDILKGDTALEYPKAKVEINNSSIYRKYYVRTTADLDSSIICSREAIDGINYILTDKISVKDMHKAAKAVFEADRNAFLAGIEE